MRIIEKKCPNCGASLEFDEKAKSCKCEYCKRSFEIERENNNFDGGYTYNLTQKTFNVFFIAIFIITIIFIGFIAVFIFSKSNFNGTRKKNNLYTNIDELYSCIDTIDSKAPWTIDDADVSLDEYGLEMQVKRKIAYVAYNKQEKKNAIIVVYKAKYKKTFDNNPVFVLVPVIYDNIKKSDVCTDIAFASSYVKGPEYYLNMEHSEYVIGYQDIETLEKDIIDPLKEQGYKITKK